MTSVKCVFKCTAVEGSPVEGSSVKITLVASYADDKGNKFLHDFAKYTPCGEMSFWCDNPSATAQFKVGSFYDIVLTEREAPQSEATAQ